eukprot:COSAG01_NODE_1537_length_9986_cov_28.165672_4_plen_170_part_00
MPTIKNCFKVDAEDTHDIDLLNGDKCNVWEPPERKFRGKIKTYQWEDIKKYFKVEEVPADMNKAYAHAVETVDSLASSCGQRSPFGSDIYYADVDADADADANAGAGADAGADAEALVDRPRDDSSSRPHSSEDAPKKYVVYEEVRERWLGNGSVGQIKDYLFPGEEMY